MIDIELKWRMRVLRIGQATLMRARWPPAFVRAYIDHCTDLLVDALRDAYADVDIVFGPHPARLPSGALRADVQYEHTLVRPGGRDGGDARPGAVPLPDGDGHYLVRLQDADYQHTLDLVFEYSRANVENLRRSGRFDAYLQRVVCVAPLLYPLAPVATAQRAGTITLFADTAQPRRRRFLDDARAAGLALRNVRRTFHPRRLQRLYARTRILVNVHQTDHHHTLEELRVLPALLCGVVVVSEDVPLKDHIPYARFIVWSDAASLHETVRDVQVNYTAHHARIFGDPALGRVIAQLARDNRDGVRAAVQRLAAGLDQTSDRTPTP